MPKFYGSSQTTLQRRTTNRNQSQPSNKKMEDARMRQNIEKDNIILLERLAKIMNPPRGGLVSSAYNLKRPPKYDREEAKLKQMRLERQRAQIEKENIAMLEKLASIMAPRPGGPTWSDYKKNKWSNKTRSQEKLPQISQEPRSVMSRKPVPKDKQTNRDFARIESENITILERLATIMTPHPGGHTWNNYDIKSLSTPKYVTKMPKITPNKGVVNQNMGRTRDQKLKDVPVRRDSIEVANLVMLERLAKVMTPTPGGPSWKDYESKTYGTNQRPVALPSISKGRGGMKQNKLRYSSKDQNESWKDINQKLPAVSSNSKQNGN
uniref:uncharacterized protein n=1 Tax=Pristiophorus japonicus TaxID=55135 RepID=UPI00398F0C45